MKWFGFSRRERRSSFLLLLLIILTFVLRYLIPEARIEVEDLTSSAAFQINSDPDKASLEAKSRETENDREGGRMTSDAGGNQAYMKKDPGGTGIAFQERREPVELNTADSALLESLPGIGAVLSVRTIKYRELLGGFCSTQQLREVYGLSEETFSILKGRIRVDTLKIRKIDINSADYAQLLRHPYLEKYDVNSILRYRELKGKITGVKDLTENKLLDSGKAARIKPYLSFE